MEPTIIFQNHKSEPQPELFDESAKPKEIIPESNRLETYHEKIKPELTERQQKVLEAIDKIQPCTMHEVADKMNVPLNTISGRFGELVKKEVLEITGKKERKSIYKIKDVA